MASSNDAEAPHTGSKSPMEPLVHLRILCPNQEVQQLSFTGLSSSTTVGQVKLKIRDVIATRPEPGIQRLLYQGKWLGRDDHTLSTVFGADAVRVNRSLGPKVTADY
jgi:Ubiquitin family